VEYVFSPIGAAQLQHTFNRVHLPLLINFFAPQASKASNFGIALKPPSLLPGKNSSVPRKVCNDADV
jgi:hypothetical protein